MMFRVMSGLLLAAGVLLSFESLQAEDPVRELQKAAIENKSTPFGHWGWEPENYMQWGTHSNRLIPVYTFGTKGAGQGVDLESYQGENSPYRSSAAIQKLFGYVPNETVNPAAEYFDQTNIFDIQLAALRAGKKHIFLVVFDGMDWQTTQAASIWKNGKVTYDSGRGNGLHMQDYQAGGTTQYGYMVTAPFSVDIPFNVNTQTLTSPVGDGLIRGGYAPNVAGPFPWSIASDIRYPAGRSTQPPFNHPYTDSSSSASSMTAGIKTYNRAVNVDVEGSLTPSIAQIAQRRGLKVGAVSSVPISHATPAAAYAHNVSRGDYQDLTRDLVGLPSVSRPHNPLPGLDVLIGTGFGMARNLDSGQGENFVPGNVYITDQDLQTIDSRSGGKYVVATRTAGVSGAELLGVAVDDALAHKTRLFGYFGTQYGHLPFQTADGKFNPTVGRTKKAEEYTEADLLENPTLSDFTAQAIRFLSQDKAPFWLMVEAGDVDWANHDNNIDNSIGAVLSGDAAIRVITDWVEKESNWDESLVIVTADHGHYLNMLRPEMLVEKSAAQPAQSAEEKSEAKSE